MAFSSNQPLITNQLPFTVNLPDIEKSAALFQDSLEDIIRNISNAVNQKEASLYTLVEQSSGQQYFKQDNINVFRNVYRLTMDFIQLNGGNILAGGAVNFPHNITGVVESAGIQANCTGVDGKRFSVVYPNTWVDATNAYFLNPLAVQLTQCDIVINILKEL